MNYINECSDLVISKIYIRGVVRIALLISINFFNNYYIIKN